MARILDIREPVWNPDTRTWVLNYVVADIIDDRNVKYIQTITCEALISVENYVKLLKERMNYAMHTM